MITSPAISDGMVHFAQVGVAPATPKMATFESSYSNGAEADALKCGSRGFFGAPTWEYGSSGGSGSFGSQRFNCAIRESSKEFSFMRSGSCANHSAAVA